MRTATGAGEMLTAIEIARDAVPQDVQVVKDEMVVHGRVSFADLKSAASIEIVIEDAAGKVVRAAGSARTDASGRYTLHIPAEVAKRLAGKEYVITARDAKGEVIHRAATPVTLEVDLAIKADVTLGGRIPIRRPQPDRPIEPVGPVGPVGPEHPAQPAEPVIFSVRGAVVKAEGKPGAGLLVRIYHKDVRSGELLGATLTNRKGEFSTTFRRHDIGEGVEVADIHFVVMNVSEKELLSTAVETKFNANREMSVRLVLTTS